MTSGTSMLMHPRPLRLIALTCLVAVQAWAQQPLPPAPADGVHDDTRALSEGSRKQLAEEIQAFRERQGIDAWFVGTTFLRDGQTLRSEARLLRQEWSGSLPAVLLLYDRSKNQEMVTFSPILWDVLPTAEIFRVREKVRDMMSDTTKPPEQRLRESMRELMRGISSLKAAEARSTQLFTQDWQRMLRWFGTALLVGAFITGIAGIFARRRDLRAARVCFMPAIQVPPRLGAPHGGGTCVTWADKS